MPKLAIHGGKPAKTKSLSRLGPSTMSANAER